MKLNWAPQTRSTRALWMLVKMGLDNDLAVVAMRRWS